MIEIALYKGTSFLSKVVKFFTRSQYSHCAFLIDGAKVAEIWNNEGVKICDISEQHESGTEVEIYKFTIPLTRSQEAELRYFLRTDAKSGYKYDYIMAMRFAPIVRLFLRKTKLPSNKLFCSEHVVSRLNAVGKELFNNTAPFQVPPDWLARTIGLEYNRTIITK